MKATIPAFAMIASLGACAQGPEPVAQLDPHEQEELAKALDGKVAGEPIPCVSTINGRNLRAIGDHTLVYRINKDLTYRNDLVGTCHGLRFGDTLVLQVMGSQYCRGDFAKVINLQTGALTGSCALGDFVPYRTPGTD